MIEEEKGAGNPSGSNQPQGFYPGTLPHGYLPFNTLQPGVLSHGPPQDNWISPDQNIYDITRLSGCPGHSPPPHNFHKDERSLRQYNKLKKKLEQKQLRDHPLNTTPPLSPRKDYFTFSLSKKYLSSIHTTLFPSMSPFRVALHKRQVKVGLLDSCF